jgi:hypothetical protein
MGYVVAIATMRMRMHLINNHNQCQLEDSGNERTDTSHAWSPYGANFFPRLRTTMVLYDYYYIC